MSSSQLNRCRKEKATLAHEDDLVSGAKLSKIQVTVSRDNSTNNFSSHVATSEHHNNCCGDCQTVSVELYLVTFIT